MKTLIITGGRFNKEFAVSLLKKNEYAYIIAVDYGLAYAKSLGVVPDLIVGDFDTYGTEGLKEYEEKGCVIRRFNPEKDDTDTEIAINCALKMGLDIDIIGAFGGRADHFLSNVNNLLTALKAGIIARLLDEGNIIFLKDRSFEVTAETVPYTYFSLLPFAGAVTGLTIKGFKYALDGYDLKPGSSRCISNELTMKTGNIIFDDGILVVINSEDVPIH